jgi:hypothetical protein
MIARRQLIGSTFFGALTGRSSTGLHAEVAQSAISERQTQEIVDGIKDLKRSIDAQHAFPEIGAIRQRQVEFLRASGKLPDFIEVGTDAWFNIYDWHVRHLQPISMGRDAANRYTIMLISTMVILRTDTAPAFIGVPYDNR